MYAAVRREETVICIYIRKRYNLIKRLSDSEGENFAFVESMVSSNFIFSCATNLVTKIIIFYCKVT